MKDTVLGIDVSKPISKQNGCPQINAYADVFNKDFNKASRSSKVSVDKDIVVDTVVLTNNDVFKQSPAALSDDKSVIDLHSEQLNIDSIQYSK